MSAWTAGIFLLLIDRHKQEVFGENVDVAGPRLYPLVPRVAITERNRETNSEESSDCRQVLSIPITMVTLEHLSFSLLSASTPNILTGSCLKREMNLSTLQ